MASLDDVGPFTWVDGEILPTETAAISVLDHAITVGDGAFETIPVHRGAPFEVQRHLERLRGSLDGLGLTCAVTDDVLEGALIEILGANGERGRRLRLTVTGGDSALGSDRAGRACRVMVGSTSAVSMASTTSVVTVPWTRNERSAVAGLKTVSYAENVVALGYAHERGASEVLFANSRDELCEGTGSNIFVVIDDELLTPPLDSGCLAGITRALVIEQTGAGERPIAMTDLARVSEAFLTSSTRDVQPIHHIDDRELPMGPRSTRARALFAAYAL